MKSLEILEHIKNAPSFMGGDDRYKNNIQSHWVFLEDIETIKQDLEILEIFKKIFEEANFHFYPDGYEADILLEDNDICIEAIDRITKLKVADVKKLKQWLEENK